MYGTHYLRSVRFSETFLGGARLPQKVLRGGESVWTICLRGYGPGIDMSCNMHPGLLPYVGARIGVRRVVLTTIVARKLQAKASCYARPQAAPLPRAVHRPCVAR